MNLCEEFYFNALCFKNLKNKCALQNLKTKRCNDNEINLTSSELKY